MIQLSITEPRIEQFFHHSKDEVIKALNFLVDNDIKEFQNDSESLELTATQKKELDSRMALFHNDPSIGRSWDEIKSEVLK